MDIRRDLNPCRQWEIRTRDEDRNREGGKILNKDGGGACPASWIPIITPIFKWLDEQCIKKYVRIINYRFLVHNQLSLNRWKEALVSLWKIRMFIFFIKRVKSYWFGSLSLQYSIFSYQCEKCPIWYGANLVSIFISCFHFLYFLFLKFC